MRDFTPDFGDAFPAEGAGPPSLGDLGPSPAALQLARVERLAVIGELTAHFAHEVANPLTLISGQIELIEKQLPKDHPILSNVQAMRAAVDRIEAVAQRTLGFGASGSRASDSCDLETVIDDARGFVEPYLKARSVWFQFSPPRERVSLSVSGGRLAQVFVNLFQNAIDAMAGSSQRTLRVRVVPAGKTVGIEVEDTGSGIPGKDLNRVFEQFFTTKGPQGTGLGLHIARRIVEDMAGEISARSGDGSTTFSITLPR